MSAAASLMVSGDSFPVEEMTTLRISMWSSISEMGILPKYKSLCILLTRGAIVVGIPSDGLTHVRKYLALAMFSLRALVIVRS